LANDAGAIRRDGSSPGRPPISQYDSLMQQGRMLSRSAVRERPGVVDQAGNVDPRLAKNPIGSIGYGATPRRFGTPRADGPLGRSSTGGSNGIGIEDPNKRRLSDSQDQPMLPRWQSGQRPTLPQLQRNSPGSFGGGSSSRTYDPARGY
jgi:hypothetical protein